MSDQPKSKCLRCSHLAGDKLDNGTLCQFARRTDTGRYDSLCVRCRFAVIDAKAADIDGIRDDMWIAGIPVRRQ